MIAAAALTFAGCGDDKDESASSSGATAATGEYSNIKQYLLDHTGPLNQSISTLSTQADAYYELVNKAGSCEAALRNDRAAVERSVKEMQATWRKANPQYEEAEGVVAGVPELADYDVILDAGASKEDDPEGAVPFNVTYKDGTVLKQPGNFFFLTETSLWGTEDKFTCPEVEADLNGDGKVEFPEALPNPEHIQASAAEMKKYTTELNGAAEKWQPTESDVFTSLVVMTPTMAEYFGAWKNSRFVAGADAKEAGFVGSSRLNDIADILAGLVLVYDNIEPQIAKKDPAQAKQTGEDLAGLRDYVVKIRDKEAGGKTFTAEQAETYGAEAQERAERIAGQVSQSASKLGVEVQD
ncbi:MAG: EfeM/EfeO family lipoprotein [Solirubrobacterales bacterium]|nr:EfeM/EfeO family lipoprotein [Solirubrobacterales bacterium]